MQESTEASPPDFASSADRRSRSIVTERRPGFGTSSARRNLRNVSRPMASIRWTRRSIEKVRGLMNRLSRRMDAEISWPAHRDATIERWENPRIPSGYTYLLQFVAHDLVHSAMPLSVTGMLGAETANARRTAAQARNPVWKRPGRLSFYVCAGYAERRAPHQAAARPHALERQGRRARLPVPRHRADAGRECHRDRPQHRRDIALRSPKRWSPIPATTITPSCRN